LKQCSFCAEVTIPVSLYIPNGAYKPKIDNLIALGLKSISVFERSDEDWLLDSALCFGKGVTKTSLKWYKGIER